MVRIDRAPAAVLGLMLLSSLAACRARPAPVRVEGRAVMVENHTGVVWTRVEIWVNDHYRATVPSLAPGGRLTAPLDTFVAGFGQRFDPTRQAVTGIEVSAKRADGGEVRLVWGRGRRR